MASYRARREENRIRILSNLLLHTLNPEELKQLRRRRILGDMGVKLDPDYKKNLMDHVEEYSKHLDLSHDDVEAIINMWLYVLPLEERV